MKELLQIVNGRECAGKNINEKISKVQNFLDMAYRRRNKNIADQNLGKVAHYAAQIKAGRKVLEELRSLRDQE